MTTNLIYAPWSGEQVSALNTFQQRGNIHPFTCGAVHSSGRSPLLVATPDEWICPDPSCDYTQDWAHAFMAASDDIVARPNKATVPCSAVGFRVRHNPHSWEPQPGMDLVRCPGYDPAASAVVAVAVPPTGQTAEAVQYWFDAATERREERDRLRAVVARVAQMADAWEQQLPEVIRTPAVVSALRAALEVADGPSRLGDEAQQQPETPAAQPVRHAPGKVILCPDCRARGHSVCMADERPRCPHCQMPHDLTPSGKLACASIRASIADTPAVVSAVPPQPEETA